ncbi:MULTISPECIES: outer membrane lipoprotein carrier protein LolA [Rhizobium/Agrobacterium group]|uniref:Outer membrane lipoprotein carrier protein LolA n=2 Tax=Neorhizobium TaxID=1525371 RepID=A0ABV0LYD9_9HYPH|nr:MULTISPECIES: outer membrane lipoprotein carrier protein LolA [Rhizobium/Agrobacterium group]KGD87455.1 membrane protein [Rhizobium sp. YS-1r]MCC2612458.1 outer membrane lipoprotein carrier protein LolA [Neorhizobium petrolearium]WGI67587.1 outer membrane lipoprotein carrier protein LolA [Neorhizobium petrolearium]
MKNEKTILSNFRSNAIGRRQFSLGLAGLAAAAFAPGLGFAQGAPGSVAAQKIADHFSSVKTMMGEFVQFGPRGEQTGGKFYIERPGKLRFNFEDPSPIRVIADGKNVVIGNLKLKTWDIYPLSKTPLSLLLASRIDLGNQMVRDVQEESDLTTIVLGNKTVFGDSTITMMFDSKTYDLRQWTITDAQNKDTSVMIYNVQNGVKFDDKVFTIPYAEVRKM